MGKSLIRRDKQNFTELLRKCSHNLLYEQGKQVHGAVIRGGRDSDLTINTAIAHMYIKCGHLSKAHNLFDKMPERDVVSWTALMCGYVKDCNGEAALLLFNEMGCSDVRPNEFTFSTNIKACGILKAVKTGEQIHGMCCKSGMEWYPEVGNSIIDMYSRCGKIVEAERVFHEMPVKSVVTWNAMIAGYALFEGLCDRSLQLFREMLHAGELPDEFTISSTIKGCRYIMGGVREGRQIHAFLIRQGYHIPSHIIIASALIDLYARSGSMSRAERVFGEMATKSVISWTALILGYAGEGSLSDAIDTFKRFSKSYVFVHDDYVLSSIISVFADFSLLEMGKQAHSFAIKTPYCCEISVTNSILDMYLKCGFTDKAEKLFENMPQKNVVSYTVIITGYGKHGLGKEAIQLFKKMAMDNIEPDDVTYLAALSACSHSGLIREGQECFASLCSSSWIKPRVEHYACMVDILGRAGRLKEAKNLIEEMPLRPNVGIWQTLLGGCRIHKDLKMGREVGNIVLRLDGDNLVNYVLLSNLFADLGCWKECETLRESVKKKGLRKDAGCSWIQVCNEIHFFSSGDEKYLLAKGIHGILRELEKAMKQETHEFEFHVV